MLLGQLTSADTDANHLGVLLNLVTEEVAILPEVKNDRFHDSMADEFDIALEGFQGERMLFGEIDDSQE